MRAKSLSHISDAELTQSILSYVAQESIRTAKTLALIGEIEARGLYADEYPSMLAFCVAEHNWDEDEALKYLEAARTARKFPTIFEAVAERRLHVEAVCLIAPHLTPDNFAELIEAATHKSETEINRMLATRFQLNEQPAKVEEDRETD